MPHVVVDRNGADAPLYAHGSAGDVLGVAAYRNVADGLVRLGVVLQGPTEGAMNVMDAVPSIRFGRDSHAVPTESKPGEPDYKHIPTWIRVALWAVAAIGLVLALAEFLSG